MHVSPTLSSTPCSAHTSYHGHSSVNEVICHGIPDKRPLLEGDIVNIGERSSCSPNDCRYLMTRMEQTLASTIKASRLRLYPAWNDVDLWFLSILTRVPCRSECDIPSWRNWRRFGEAYSRRSGVPRCCHCHLQTWRALQGYWQGDVGVLASCSTTGFTNRRSQRTSRQSGRVLGCSDFHWSWC